MKSPFSSFEKSQSTHIYFVEGRLILANYVEHIHTRHLQFDLYFHLKFDQ